MFLIFEILHLFTAFNLRPFKSFFKNMLMVKKHYLFYTKQGSKITQRVKRHFRLCKKHHDFKKFDRTGTIL